MATRGHITCGICSQPIGVTFVRVSGNGSPVVLQLLDAQPLADHMQTCAGRKALAPAAGAPVPLVPREELAGRIRQFLDTRAFVSNGGSRACTMCGLKGAECMTRLGRSRKGCCPACEAGNTHPAPGEAVGSCAVWAAGNVGPVR